MAEDEVLGKRPREGGSWLEVLKEICARHDFVCDLPNTATRLRALRWPAWEGSLDNPEAFVPEATVVVNHDGLYMLHYHNAT